MSAWGGGRSQDRSPDRGTGGGRMQFPPPSHTDFRGQSSRGPYRGHTAGDVGPAAGGLTGEGGEDAVSHGATILEGPG
jgi:hypothetical protein